MAKTNIGEDIEAEVHEVQKDEEAGEKDASLKVDPGISAVAQFDQLVANRGVLTTSETERKFLDFVTGSAIVSSSLRADRAESEQEYLCQRVDLANQEAARLRAALEKTRLELQVVVTFTDYRSHLQISMHLLNLVRFLVYKLQTLIEVSLPISCR